MLQRMLQPTHSEPAITGGLTPDTRNEAAAETPADTSPADPPRLIRLLHRLPKTGASLHDPLLDWPSLVEDDYYRFRNRPSGW